MCQVFPDTYEKLTSTEGDMIFLLPLYPGSEVWELGGYLESKPSNGIEFVSREITLRYHISR